MSTPIATCRICTRQRKQGLTTLLYRTSILAKRVKVRVCNECLAANPAGYSIVPPRAVATRSREFGKIYRTQT